MKGYRTFLLRDRYLILIQKLGKLIYESGKDPRESELLNDFYELLDDIFKDSVIIKYDDIKESTKFKERVVYYNLGEGKFISKEEYDSLDNKEGYEYFADEIIATYPEKNTTLFIKKEDLFYNDRAQIKDELAYKILTSFDKED